MTPIEQCSPLLQELKRRVDRLSKLLEEPEPRLFMWQSFVADAVKAIGDIYGEHL